MVLCYISLLFIKLLLSLTFHCLLYRGHTVFFLACPVLLSTSKYRLAISEATKSFQFPGCVMSFKMSPASQIDHYYSVFCFIFYFHRQYLLDVKNNCFQCFTSAFCHAGIASSFITLLFLFCFCYVSVSKKMQRYQNG